MSAFAFFDRAHQENFCASVLLFTLTMERSSGQFFSWFAEYFRELAALPAAAQLVEFGREAHINPDEEDGRRRSDIWLRYQDGGDSWLVLVEVKTRRGWDLDGVMRQLLAQRASEIRQTRPHQVILLAPRELTEQVEGFTALSWGTLLRELPQDTPLVRAAHEHLMAVINPVTGASDQGAAAITPTLAMACVLTRLIDDCINALGGNASGSKLWLVPARSEQGWKWQSLSRKFKCNDQHYWIGVYDYLEAPAGQEAELGPRLELYRGSDRLAHTRIEGDALTAEILSAVRQALVEQAPAL